VLELLGRVRGADRAGDAGVGSQPESRRVEIDDCCAHAVAHVEVWVVASADDAIADPESACTRTDRVDEANDFVTGFLGHERVLKLLSVTSIDPAGLEQVAYPAEAPRVSASATLADALAELLEAGRESVPVYDDGRYLGDFSARSLQESLRALPTSKGDRPR